MKLKTGFLAFLVLPFVCLGQLYSQGLKAFQLRNGMSVFVWEDSTKTDVLGQVVVRTGSVNDPEQYTGLAHYLEHVLFKGTQKIGALDWEKEKPLYEQIASGIAPLGENEYYKERHISSSYPETLLSGNSDYISSGEDREFERIKVDNAAEALEAYRNGFRSVDAALGDELEVLFISMYTSFVNGL